MIDETLLAALGSTDTEAEAMLTQAFGKRVESDDQSQYMDSFLGDQIKDLSAGKLIKGKVVGFAGEDVVIEVGLKSEGLVPKEEFEGTPVKVGDVFDVLLESMEGEEGLIVLSKRKADRMLNWQRIMDTTKEGDVVEGTCMRKIKGGLLVDIGVPVDLQSCHTAMVGGYVIEGHVPTQEILRVLAQRPTATGLAVAGMPIGSPGMEMGGQPDRYDVMLFSASGRQVFARY